MEGTTALSPATGIQELSFAEIDWVAAGAGVNWGNVIMGSLDGAMAGGVTGGIAGGVYGGFVGPGGVVGGAAIGAAGGALGGLVWGGISAYNLDQNKKLQVKSS